MELILASASPRRRELLSRLGLEFAVLAAQADETLLPSLSPREQVIRLSAIKAQAVREALESRPGQVIVSADTVVVLDNAILGKPKDTAQAAEMLRALSGRTHLVLTGVTVLTEDGPRQLCEETQVFFRPLRETEITAYIRTGEPMDKAGAYGIQGYGALFVEKLIGDYYNVMGLPLCALGRLLREASIPILEATL